MDDLNDNIARAWGVMKNFCSLINLSVEAQGRIPWDLLYNTMTSVMYRLLDMHFNLKSINEAARLGLLAFCSQVFLQWKFGSITYTHLGASCRDCWNRAEIWNSIPPQLSLWLLMIGRISVFEQCDRSWMELRLRASINSCGIQSWIEMQDILRSSMWISWLQEDRGKEIFDSVFRP